jgi:hypothetical protein
MNQPWVSMIDCPVSANVFCSAIKTAAAPISSFVVNCWSTVSFSFILTSFPLSASFYLVQTKLEASFVLPCPWYRAVLG